MRIVLEDVQQWACDAATNVEVLQDSYGRHSVAFDGRMALGKYDTHSLRPGLVMMILNLYVPRKTELAMEHPDPSVGFAMALSGGGVQTISDGPGYKSSLEIDSGKELAAACPSGTLQLTLGAEQNHKLVKIQIAPEALDELVDGSKATIGGSLGGESRTLQYFDRSAKRDLSPAMELLAHQVVQCDLNGAPRRLYMEAKALEIIAHELGSFSMSKPLSKQRYKTEELERLWNARAILDREYTEPPQLLTLARRVGLNDFKLKRGFKDVFETTVFGYVRKLRMEKALSLLVEGELTVTEVALEIGYSCPGHFSTAFKNRFGVLPSKYKRDHLC